MDRAGARGAFVNRFCMTMCHDRVGATLYSNACNMKTVTLGY